MRSLNFFLPAAPRFVAAGLLLCALIPALSGCVSSAAGTRVLPPPIPTTPGAVVTDNYVCIPHAEAAELMLWMEYMEELCR